MERLTDALHAAVADPPPTSIEIDRLIGRHRRNQLQFRVGAATGAAVLTAAAVAVPALMSGHLGVGLSAAGPGGACQGPQRIAEAIRGSAVWASALPGPVPSGSAASAWAGSAPAASGGTDPNSTPSTSPPVPESSRQSLPPVVDTSPSSSAYPVPSPTEDCAATVARLDATLRGELARQLRGTPYRVASDKNHESGFLAAGSRYLARVTLVSGDRQVDLTVWVHPENATAWKAAWRQSCASEPAQCRTESDGTLVRIGSQSTAYAVSGGMAVVEPSRQAGQSAPATTQSMPATTRSLPTGDLSSGPPPPTGAAPRHSGGVAVVPSRVVMVLRPDGTAIDLELAGVPASGGTVTSDLPLTAEQLVAIGRQLTLFP